MPAIRETVSRLSPMTTTPPAARSSEPVPFILLIIVCMAGVQVLGVASAALGSRGISGWFSELTAPAGNPPAWVFAIVWPVLYAMIGASLALIIRRGGRAKKPLLVAFAAQMLLNVAWTPVFFGAYQITAALVVIVALWIAIAVLIALLWPRIRSAAWLLVPYFLWVSYAMYLNYGYWTLNVG